MVTLHFKSFAWEVIIVYKVSSEQFVFSMSKDNPAVLSVPSGSKIVFETSDALDGQVRSESQSIDTLDWGRVNPATGPVAIENAKPGDALKVTVENIEVSGDGVMAAIPGLGILEADITEASLVVLPIKDGYIPFSSGISLPFRPMIGVIGVAPSGDSVPCGTPGSHGGNMDCKLIAPGSILYLPVFHLGGLLAMGDVHACMGDGEIMGTGVECAATVTVTVELIKNLNITDPMLEVSDMIYSVTSADTLENASKIATCNIRDMVASKMNIDKNTAGMLLSAIGQLEICQVVDPLLTVRFGVPKKYVWE